jgi:hypothetical protein
MYGLWQYYQVQSFIIFAQRQWNLGKQSYEGNHDPLAK